MRISDALRYTGQALLGYPMRSFLMLLAMSIAVSGVLLLSTLGDSARLYVVNQFAALGTHMLYVLPGKTETTGGQPPMLGEIPRDLTLDDAAALLRSRAVAAIAPLTLGQAPVAYRGKNREVTIIGTTAPFLGMRGLSIDRGRFLPPGGLNDAAAVCVLGQTLAHELFGRESPIGQAVRIENRRFQVLGVLAERGQALGPDIGDLAIIPVATAQQLFNTSTLFRILIEARDRDAIATAQADVRRIIQQRHGGEEDVTVITQDAMLATFDRILRVLTWAVTAISAISMVVAGILIMNVMLIAVAQRTAEIGLLKAIGAPARRIRNLFLLEAALLSLVGALSGLAFSALARAVLQMLFPGFPLALPAWAVGAALLIALGTGIAFGVAPARRAAALNPVQALSGRTH
ncbi:MAG: ABC transporter permease [Thiotrichales bacterium]